MASWRWAAVTDGENAHMSADEAQRKSTLRLRRSYFRRTNNEAAREWEAIETNNHLSEAVAELWSGKASR